MMQTQVVYNTKYKHWLLDTERERPSFDSLLQFKIRIRMIFEKREKFQERLRMQKC
jgi:hypothetical protein